MGWLSYTIHTSPKKEMDHIYGDFQKHTFEVEVDGQKIKRDHQLLRSFLYGNEYYGAVRVVDHYPEGDKEEVVAAVDLIWYSPKSWKSENFGYKPMGETMGPYCYHCPKTILDLLTPTDNEYALHWRSECQKRNEKNSKLRKLKHGAQIRFINPYENLISGHKQGSIITLNLRKYGKAAGTWDDGSYRWPLDLIPNEFEIIEGGK